ncbi:MAG: hypothetical protein RAO94_11345 [Candidatus Stygibacter australis]|nr:hypothetical protein [Candidatus Stygibacter australis]
MKNWLIAVLVALLLLFYVNCQADGYPKNIPVFTGDINDPEVYVVDYEDEYLVVEYNGEIYYYPIE